MRAWPVLLTLIAALPSITGVVTSHDETNSRHLQAVEESTNQIQENIHFSEITNAMRVTWPSTKDTKEGDMKSTEKQKLSTKETKTSTKESHEVKSRTAAKESQELPASQRLLREKAQPAATQQQDKKQVVEQLEKSLLSLFGMSSRPSRKNSPIIIPPAMRKLYEEATKARNSRQATENGFSGGLGARRGLHAGTANTVRSFTHTESPIDNRFTSKHRFRLHFNVSSIPAGESLKAAELSLHHIHSGQNQRVLIYDLVRPGIKGRREPLLRLVDSKILTPKSGDQVSLDVYPAVERWINQPTDNHGLIVHVMSKEEHGLRLRRDTETDLNQPTLLTYTDDGRGSPSNLREKRAASSQRRAHRRKNSQDVCQRRPLYVDFTDVGWTDWIVAPPGYDAYYCYGDCPFPLAEHLNSTNHAIVQNLVNGVNPSAVPKACCVPTQLSSISMLYLDEENKVVLKNYQDMAVVGCGCR